VLRKILVPAAVLAAALGVAFSRADAATPKASAPSPTRGIVLINTNLALEDASAAGTGIVLTKSGEVVTNNHVIRGATSVKVTVPATHKTYPATVVGYDIADDVALLQLQGASNLATATVGNSARLKVGQSTRAVGNANGGGRLVQTIGRVTALNRTISVQDDNGGVAQLRNLIQTSAHLVPGDSGGPLLDATNRVIGIDAAGSPTFAFNGNAPGYAIPINRAVSIVKQIAAQRASALVHIGATAFIGLSLDETPNGIAVHSVVSSSPADKAGLVQGDVITTLDGTQVSSYNDVRSFLFAKHPGDNVTIAYTDPLGNPGTTTIVLASGPPQ
jgi:S1-C subfamily serine protease